MRLVEYTIDINKSSYNYKACMQSDDLELKITLYNNSLAYDLTGSEINLNWALPDGTPLIKKDISKKDNTITVELDKTFTSIKGKVKFELEIIKNGQTTTFPLELIIVQKVLESKAVNDKIIDILETVKIDDAIDSFMDGIKTNVKELSSQMDDKAKQIDLNVLEARFDNIIATAGDGTIPSELSDLRVNYKGETFRNANSRISNSEEKIKEIGNKVNIISENLDISTTEPADGDIPKLFFEGNITGMSKEVSKDLKLEYISKNTSFSCTVEMKWQGTSSIGYPKKNFNIKMYENESKTTKLEKSFKSWGKTNKYCLKANYIDHTHSRNIVSANIASSLKTVNSQLPVDTPNNGQIDGFPIKLYINGNYQGIYTLNIPKGGWMFGMDKDNPNHLLYSCEGWGNSCIFKALSPNDDTEWCEEFPETGLQENRDKLNRLISFVKDSTDEDFKNNFGSYFNKESIFNYFILMQLLLGQDNQAKNMLLATYNGEIWYTHLYDLDSTAGLKYDGSTLLSYTLNVDSGKNLLWTRLRKIFGEELKNHYLNLSKNLLSKTTFIDGFEKFSEKISNELFSEDLIIYPNIPSPQLDYRTIRTFMTNRIDYINKNIDSFFLLRVLDITNKYIIMPTYDSNSDNSSWSTFSITLDDFTEIPETLIINSAINLPKVTEIDSIDPIKYESYTVIKWDGYVYLQVRLSINRVAKGDVEAFRTWIINNCTITY